MKKTKFSDERIAEVQRHLCHPTFSTLGITLFTMLPSPTRSQQKGLDVIHNEKADKNGRDRPGHEHKNRWPKIVAQTFPKNL